MSGDRYFIQGQNDVYFITCTVVYWVDLFSRRNYRSIIVDSLNYCIEHKGLRVYAWVIMSNHIHLICKVESDLGISGFLRDFKKYTSKAFIKEMKQINESRREWMQRFFSFEAKRSGRASNFKIWKDDNHSIWMHDIDIWSKIDYIHNNPVVQEIVDSPNQYIYLVQGIIVELKDWLILK
ncbi:MAG: transposase [Cytophagales bacterium]